MKKLNLGCGQDVREGYINVDFTKDNGAEVVWNLEEYPYPFEDNSIDYILMDNVLEHLENTIRVMEELHRISKQNTIIKIIVPHNSGCMAFGHLTHKQYFSSESFEKFGEGNWQKYSQIDFELLKNRLIWLDCRDWFWIRPLKIIIDKIINIHPFLSERFLANLLGGFDHILFELRVIKKVHNVNLKRTGEEK